MFAGSIGRPRQNAAQFSTVVAAGVRGDLRQPPNPPRKPKTACTTMIDPQS